MLPIDWKIDIECGDIILFERPCFKMSILTAFICYGAKMSLNTSYDHVGVVLEDPLTKELCLLEANINGITKYNLKQRLLKTTANSIAVRKLQGPKLSENDKFRLWEISNLMISKVYNTSFPQMMTGVFHSYTTHAHPTMKEQILIHNIDTMYYYKKLFAESYYMSRLIDLRLIQLSPLINQYQNQLYHHIHKLDSDLKTDATYFESLNVHSKYFCSQLVADLLIHAGIIVPDIKDVQQYVPVDFSSTNILTTVLFKFPYSYSPNLIMTKLNTMSVIENKHWVDNQKDGIENRTQTNTNISSDVLTNIERFFQNSKSNTNSSKYITSSSSSIITIKNTLKSQADSVVKYTENNFPNGTFYYFNKDTVLPSSLSTALSTSLLHFNEKNENPLNRYLGNFHILKSDIIFPSSRTCSYIQGYNNIQPTKPYNETLSSSSLLPPIYLTATSRNKKNNYIFIPDKYHMSSHASSYSSALSSLNDEQSNDTIAYTKLLFVSDKIDGDIDYVESIYTTNEPDSSQLNITFSKPHFLPLHEIQIKNHLIILKQGTLKVSIVSGHDKSSNSIDNNTKKLENTDTSSVTIRAPCILNLSDILLNDDLFLNMLKSSSTSMPSKSLLNELKLEVCHDDDNNGDLDNSNNCEFLLIPISLLYKNGIFTLPYSIWQELQEGVETSLNNSTSMSSSWLKDWWSYLFWHNTSYGKDNIKNNTKSIIQQPVRTDYKEKILSEILMSTNMNNLLKKCFKGSTSLLTLSYLHRPPHYNTADNTPLPGIVYHNLGVVQTPAKYPNEKVTFVSNSYSHGYFNYWYLPFFIYKTSTHAYSYSNSYKEKGYSDTYNNKSNIFNITYKRFLNRMFTTFHKTFLRKFI